MRDRTKLEKLQTHNGKKFPEDLIQYMTNEDGSLNVIRVRHLFSIAGLMPPVEDLFLMHKIAAYKDLLVAFRNRGGIHILSNTVPVKRSRRRSK